jgi:hypothetical protein
MEHPEEEKRRKQRSWGAVLMGSGHETEDSISPMSSMQLMVYSHGEPVGAGPKIAII